jgi:hypothetical protein
MRFAWLGVLIAFAANAEGDPADGTRLQLCWLDADGRYPLMVEPMKREVVSILGATGIEVVWLDALRAPTGPVLGVTLMKEPPATWRVPAHAMGATPVQAAKREAVYVFLPAIMRALGLDPRMERLPTPRERIEIARAIARVVVHEVVHVVAPGVDHGETSVMRQALSRHALQQEGARIEPEVADALRAGVKRFHGN